MLRPLAFFWKKRLHELATRLEGDTKELAFQAARKMGTIEAESAVTEE
jgi:hypothetical protein